MDGFLPQLQSEVPKQAVEPAPAPIRGISIHRMLQKRLQPFGRAWLLFGWLRRFLLLPFLHGALGTVDGAMG